MPLTPEHGSDGLIHSTVYQPFGVPAGIQTKIVIEKMEANEYLAVDVFFLRRGEVDGLQTTFQHMRRKSLRDNACTIHFAAPVDRHVGDGSYEMFKVRLITRKAIEGASLGVRLYTVSG